MSIVLPYAESHPCAPSVDVVAPDEARKEGSVGGRDSVRRPSRPADRGRRLTADGERIGYLMGGDAHELQVGDGFLFISVYTIPIARVERYEDGHLVLRLTAEQFEQSLGG